MTATATMRPRSFDLIPLDNDILDVAFAASNLSAAMALNKGLAAGGGLWFIEGT
jgi:hypothetical protein